MFDMVTTPGFVVGIVLGIGVPMWLTQSTPKPSLVVSLGYATFSGAAHGPVSSFLGMPYAAPPLGDLRFARPQPPPHISDIQNATQYGPGCYQQALSMRGANGEIKPFVIAGETSSEDCLSINVIKPANVAPNAKLPVVFSIHGGGFAVGTTSKMDFGIPLVARSRKLGIPVIYVSANYRLNAFGFLASEDVDEEVNLNAGLYDQRAALEWTRRYISHFGGDPKRVIIVGQSAGAISVGLHMIANGGNTDGLFRGAVMQSGAPFRLAPYTSGQPYTDVLARLVNCSPSSGQSTLTCLRAVPADALVDAIQKTPDLMGYESVKLAWQPRREVSGKAGELWTEEPWRAIEAGRVAKVPFIITSNDDEGTMFALGSLNVTTSEQFKSYIQYLTGMTPQQAEEVATAYPEDPARGSPFGTGQAFRLSPQYKRLSAFLGDLSFHAPHRYFLEHLAAKRRIPAWAYVFKAGKRNNMLGAYHGADMGTMPMLESGFDFLINFAYTLNPNIRPLSNPLKCLSSPSSLFIALKNFSPSSFSIPTFTSFVSPLLVLPPLSQFFPKHTTLPYHWPPYTSHPSGNGALLAFSDASSEDAHPASKSVLRPPASDTNADANSGDTDKNEPSESPKGEGGDLGAEDLGLARGQRLWKVEVEEDLARREAMEVLVGALKSGEAV